MAIPNRRQFVCPENITFPTSENFFFLLKSFLCFKSYKLVFKGHIAPPLQSQTTFQKDLLRQFLSSLFFSFFFFLCRQKFLLSLGFSVSTFPPRAQRGWLLSVGLTEFLLLFPPQRSSKSSFVSRNGSCHSSRVFFSFFFSKKEVCVYVCRRKEGPGANQSGTNSLSEFQSFSVHPNGGVLEAAVAPSLSLSSAPEEASAVRPDVEFALGGG